MNYGFAAQNPGGNDFLVHWVGTRQLLIDWRIHGWILAVYLIFALLWYHAVRPLINGNAVILVALFIAGALEAIRHGRDEFAGVLLAFSTIKPQLVVLIIPFILFWSITVQRWKILIWLLITLVILSVSAMIFVIDWPLQNLVEVLRYPGYNPPGTPGAAFSTWWPVLGSRLGWGLTIVLGIVLGIEWYLVRGKDYRWFLWTACLTLVISQWIGIQTDPGNFIVLFIPLVLIMATWEVRWGVKKGQIVALVMMIMLFVGVWGIFLATIDYGDQPQQAPIMFFPLPLFILVGLYWVRWWAIKPSKFLIETLQTSEHI